jgi:muramoyltetrapeptide carboxypeptidase
VWDALRAAEPKVLVGYSDITALHQAVATRLGIVSLHAPMPGTRQFLDSPAAQQHLRTTLFDPEAVQVLTHTSARAIVGGVASGITTGGCASVLATSVGTPTAPASAAGLVLIEDTCEKAYRIDSFLTQLRRSGWFADATGVVLGSWQDCEPPEAVVADVLGDLGVPILADLGFGHGEDPLTVPLGVLAELDADAGKLTLSQPALA